MPIRMIQFNQFVKSALRIWRAFPLAKDLVGTRGGIWGLGPRNTICVVLLATIVSNAIRATLLREGRVSGGHRLLEIKKTGFLARAN